MFFQIKFVLSKNLWKYECYEQKCDFCVFNGGQYIIGSGTVINFGVFLDSGTIILAVLLFDTEE